MGSTDDDIKMKINQLFPVIIPEFKYEGDLESIISYLNTVEKAQFNFPEGVYTTKGDLHKHDALAEVTAWFYECLNEYKQEMALQWDRLDISLMWANNAPQDLAWVTPATVITCLLFLLCFILLRE